MNVLQRLLMLLLIVASPATVWGHGSPIELTVLDNQLSVGGGLTDEQGYAPQLFVQPGSTGDPEDADSFTNFGPAVYWIVPGLEITGLEENSGLLLEVLARPVADSQAAEQRLLWYWNPISTEVERAPQTQLQIRRSATVNMLLTPDTLTAPAPIQIAAPLTSDMNYHNHNLLRYLLPDPLPLEGAYAFFARFRSNVYDPSNPFLILLNNGGLSDEQMTEAALAINAAAVDGLPGDFNRDGTVDAADYTVWRDGLGTTHTAEQYEIWRTHFGQPNSGDGGAGGIVSAVPEAGAFGLAVCGASILLATIRSMSDRIRSLYSARSAT